MIKENALIPKMYFKFFKGKVYQVKVANFLIDLVIDDMKFISYPVWGRTSNFSSTIVSLDVLKITYNPNEHISRVIDKKMRKYDSLCMFLRPLLKREFIKSHVTRMDVLVFTNTDYGQVNFSVENIKW